EPDRGSHARGHDAACPGRGSQCRLLPELGAVLVSPETLLRGQGERVILAVPPAPLRRGSLRLSIEPLRPHLLTTAPRPGLPGDETDRGLAQLGSADLPLGQRPGRCG